MVILLEGVDGSGKTTLAEQLAGAYEGTIVHVGPPKNPRTAFAELIELLLDAETNYLTIFDRFHFGNLAYGEVFRGTNDLLPLEWQTLERFIARGPHLMVLCSPPMERVEQTIADRRKAGVLDPRGFEDSVSRTRTVNMLMNEAYFDRCHLSRHVYDWTFPGGFGVLCHEVENVLTRVTP